MLVTGRHGQIARSLVERGQASGHEIVLIGRPEFDLAGEPAVVASAIIGTQPDVIVSAAAFTAVDKAEDQRELAFAVNSRGASAVAEAAAALSVPLVHMSTDYVFDGAKGEPYVEGDATNPTGVYGASKLAGEEAVQAIHRDVAILRTAWVYSPFGSNFVKTMLRLAATRDQVEVVADQLGNPTNALDVADAILAVATNLLSSESATLRGIFHLAGEGEASWADLGEAVFAAAASNGGPSAAVHRISTSEYPTPATRPADSRLDVSKLARVHGIRLPSWRRAVPQVVSRLIREAA